MTIASRNLCLITFQDSYLLANVFIDWWRLNRNYSAAYKGWDINSQLLLATAGVHYNFVCSGESKLLLSMLDWALASRLQNKLWAWLGYYICVCKVLKFCWESSINKLSGLYNKNAISAHTGQKLCVVVLADHAIAFASQAEGHKFDPRGRHTNLLLMVAVLSQKLVIRMPPSLKGQKKETRTNSWRRLSLRCLVYLSPLELT